MRATIITLPRRFSAVAAAPLTAHAGDRKMGAWQVHAYGDDVAEELQYSDRVKIPPITDANDVLVRVTAASLNGIDLEMGREWISR